MQKTNKLEYHFIKNSFLNPSKSALTTDAITGNWLVKSLIKTQAPAVQFFSNQESEAVFE